MDESFGNHFHACFHLHLAISMSIGASMSLGSCDCSSYKKNVSDIFLCFWLVIKVRKAIIYNSSMLCDLKPTHKFSHPRLGAKMLMILEARCKMQCYDAMRDLRVKIGVLEW